MKSNSKIVRDKVRNHILEYFEYDTPENESNWSPEKSLISQVNYMIEPKESIYQVGKRLVEGGQFLIYNDDQRDFLKDLELNNNSKKTFSDDEVYQMYMHLLASEIEKIYNKEG